MSTSATTPPRRKPGKWVVALNYRNRTALYAVLFATLGAHLYSQGGYGPLAWGLLALYFLGFPHVLYWRARRAPDGGAAELDNMTLDAVGFGLWSGALHFPLWIAFILLCGAVVNLTVFRGPRGTLLALAVFSASALAAWALGGGGLAPEMAWPATALSIVNLLLFLMVVTSGAYYRSLQLHDMRERLRTSEHALQTTNDAMQLQLDEIHALQSQLREQANRDPLTGLFNRRYLDATMERELARCKRDGLPLSLMLIDIDHFKKINDTWGHQAGDEVLRHLASMLNVRASDIASRYGGEEFLVLLPGMPQSTAQERAEQYRKSFEAGVTHFGEFRIHATLSTGIASYPEHARTVDELIRGADRAMYRAKAGGRNRVEICESPDPAATA